MESASLGFLVMTLCLEVVVLFTALSLVHPAVITLPTNPGQLLPWLLTHLIWWPDIIPSLVFLPPTMSSASRPLLKEGVLRYIVLQIWTDLWVHIIGTFKKIWLSISINIIQDYLIRKHEQLIMSIMKTWKEAFQDCFFCSYWLTLGQTAIFHSSSYECLLSHIFVHLRLWAKGQDFISASTQLVGLSLFFSTNFGTWVHSPKY